MDQGIYAASSGGLVENRRIEVVSNNIANVNTVGFKAQRIVGKQQEFSDTLASIIGAQARAFEDQERVPGVTDIRTVTDFSPGPVSHTGNPLNVALSEPDTFFVVNTPEGEQYTRAGNFTLDAQGNIVTADGFAILGEGGPVTISQGAPNISSNGTVTSGGATIGRLRTVRFEDSEALERVGSARFKANGGVQPTVVEASMVPQSVEMPNVNIVESIVEMISAQRSFEAYAKTVETIDELNSTSLRSAASTGG
jgi:flagellar basal body rod protein FlgG